jgi:hypothetical protein
MYEKLDLLPHLGQSRNTPTINQWRIALSKGPNRVGVILPSREDRNKSSFQNDVVSSYLKFRTMDKVQEPNDSECYIPS